MPYSGASLRSAGSRVCITTDDIAFPPQLKYGANKDFIKFFILSYLKLLDDSPLNTPFSFKPSKVYWKFLKELRDTHVSVTIKKYSGYSHEILSDEYSTGGDTSTRVFHDFMIDTPVFKEYHTWIKTGRPELLRYVQTFLLFGKKLEYDDPEFDTTALRGWLEVEDKLRTLTFSKNDVSSLRNIVSEILPPLKVDHLLPKFGPGKVAERGVRDVFDKLSSLQLHPRLGYAFDRERPKRSQSEGFGCLTAIKKSSEHSGEVGRLKFVPKDITKSRSICMEPNAFMYFQQEVHRWIRNTIKSGPIGRFVDIEDQSLSQMAAIHGSIYLSTDTIDLSSASDSVHVDLVRGILPRDLLFYVMATRTSKVELPGGSVVSVFKLAPMGSAVCFPIQCIVFTAVCIYAAICVSLGEETGGRVVTKAEVSSFLKDGFHKSRGPFTPFTKRFEPPVVYGDDIAVDSRTTSSVVTTLVRLGFTVNRSKSFTGSQTFRESCGVFAFDGQDITPVQFRLPFFKRGNWDAKVYSSFIGAINWANDNGFQSLASFYLSALRGYGFRYRLPFTSDRASFGIYTKNKHRVPAESRKWDAACPNGQGPWQTEYEVVQGIGPKRSKKRAVPDNLESYRYDQWWRSRVRGNTPFEESRSLRIRPQETRLAPLWARCE